MKKVRTFAFLSLVLFASLQTVKSQVTTSSLSGRVTDDVKETMVGAAVRATHEPS